MKHYGISYIYINLVPTLSKQLFNDGKKIKKKIISIFKTWELNASLLKKKTKTTENCKFKVRATMQLALTINQYWEGSGRWHWSLSVVDLVLYMQHASG